ncbi:MAG TPA: gluconate 2-dehydrogenase subunit 3 family protein [Crenalkalicoccus sp.]|nr:gluconate 2-dehydrogenase subunit 3 family protein [Crenalkalicoccus sp.]
MRELDRRIQFRRRGLLRGAAVAVPAGALAMAGAGISAEAAWAQAATALQPKTMATLVRMSRDIYPHDRIPDLHYVKAVQPFDAGAAQDSALRSLLEDGVGQLDAQAQERFRVAYLQVPAEADRVLLLKGIESTPFFAKLRGDLIVSFYNQHDLWRRFGYEGSSAEHGGYIHRGFDDIDWLPKA